MPFPYPVFAPGVIQQLRVGVYVDFALDEVAHPGQRIFPGQPLSFRWGVYDYRVRTPQTEDPAYATATATLLFSGNVLFGPGAERTARIPILDRGEGLARAFYQIGQTVPLQLEVTGAGLPALTATLSLDVVGEHVDATWWEWDRGPITFRWKQDTYMPSGRLHNRSLWSRMTGVPVLHFDEIAEDTPLPSQRLVPQGAPTFDLAPNSVTPVAFPGIQETWEWFNRILLIPDAPMERRFNERVAFTVTDQFGNVYPETLSPSEAIFFQVSDEKALELGFAFHSQIAAIALSGAAISSILIPPLSAGLAAGAVTAESAAQIAAGAALDPPEPNPNFMEPVQFVAPPLPAALLQSPQLAGFASFLDFAGRILAARDALSETHSRLLGARAARNSEGMNLQTTTYLNLVNQMMNDTANLLQQLPDVTGGLEATKLFDPQMLRQTLTTWQQQGFPQDLLDNLSKAGLSKEGLANLDAAVRDPSTGKQIMTLQDALQQMAWALAGVTYEIRKGVPEILNISILPQMYVTGPHGPEAYLRSALLDKGVQLVREGLNAIENAMSQAQQPEASTKAQAIEQVDAGVLSSPKQAVAPADQSSKLAEPSSVPAQPSLPSKDELEATLVMPAPSQPAVPKAQVQLPSGRTIPLTTEQVMVGRGVSDTSEVAAIDLSSEQEQATVSRVHAQITRVEDHFEIEDHNSSNQTRLNHEILVPRRRYHLRDGDVIEFGKVRCVFSLE